MESSSIDSQLLQSFEKLARLPQRVGFWELVKESRRVGIPLRQYRILYFGWQERRFELGSVVVPKVEHDRPDVAIEAASTNHQQCRRCNSNQVRQAAGSGPHYKRLECGQCGGFIKWIGKPKETREMQKL